MGRSLRPPLTGIGRHTANLVRGLAGRLSPGDLSVYIPRDAAAAVADVRCRVVSAPIPTPHELLRGLWEQTWVARDVRARRPDVYHSPNYGLPLALPCPSVVTVHDLAFLDRRFHHRRLGAYLRFATALSVRRATHVIAVSQYTRDRMLATYPVASDRVSVVYNGLDPRYETLPSARAVQRFLATIAQARPYVLFVGTIEPRKNLPRLVRAFELVAPKQPALDLLICGTWGWRYGAAREAIERSAFRDRIRVLGYLPSADLPLLYAGARVLVYPSLEEGFGFPPLEAMAMGTPVITSDTSALPEVVGDAGVLVDPTDVGAITAALLRLLDDEALADRLRQCGLERARRFTWDRATVETLAVYAHAVEQRAGA